MRYAVYTDYSNLGTLQGMQMKLEPSEQLLSTRQTDEKRPRAIFIAEVYCYLRFSKETWADFGGYHVLCVLQL